VDTGLISHLIQFCYGSGFSPSNPLPSLVMPGRRGAVGSCCGIAGGSESVGIQKYRVVLLHVWVCDQIRAFWYCVGCHRCIWLSRVVPPCHSTPSILIIFIPQRQGPWSPLLPPTIVAGEFQKCVSTPAVGLVASDLVARALHRGAEGGMPGGGGCFNSEDEQALEKALELLRLGRDPVGCCSGGRVGGTVGDGDQATVLGTRGEDVARPLAPATVSKADAPLKIGVGGECCCTAADAHKLTLRSIRAWSSYEMTVGLHSVPYSDSEPPS
jgi:hypothetical protein